MNSPEPTPTGKPGEIVVFMVRREDVRDVTFPKLPAGLITKPTLVWRLTCDKPGKHLTNLTYLIQYTDQLSNPNWVSLATNSGTGATITNSYSVTNAASGFYRIQVQ